MTPQDQITDEQRRKITKAFRDAVQSIKDGAKIRQLAALIEKRDIDGVIELLGLNRATFAPLEQAIKDSYETGGRLTAELLNPIPVPNVGDVVMRFDVQSPAAIEWAAMNSSKLITEIVEEQKEIVRGVISLGVEAGDNPATTALDLVGRIDSSGKRVGGLIGLTTQQQGWIESAREELKTLDDNYLSRKLRDPRLDAAFRNAKRNGRALTDKQVNAMITRLQARTERYRAEVIGRTESVTSLRAGQFEALKQAADKGQINASDITKEWDATNDSKTRHTHTALEGVKIPLLQPFSFVGENGGFALYPGDNSLGAPAEEIIQCRCFINYRIDFIGRAVRKVRGF